jgi:predicted nuclease of restriction endonuclease-like RecB superfamily
VLDLSGPLSLFRRTLLYGRALGGLVPQLAWCQSFRLQAVCALQGRSLVLEERFARDFRRTAPGWDVVHEPEPVAAGDALVFPDFALQHRLDPSRRWLLEIVGFWTPEYLARKLASYRAAGLPISSSASTRNETVPSKTCLRGPSSSASGAGSTPRRWFASSISGHQIESR